MESDKNKIKTMTTEIKTIKETEITKMKTELEAKTAEIKSLNY